MTKKETYELVIKQLLVNIKEIDFADYEGDAIEEAPELFLESCPIIIDK